MKHSNFSEKQWSILIQGSWTSFAAAHCQLFRSSALRFCCVFRSSALRFFFRHIPSLFRTLALDFVFRSFQQFIVFRSSTGGYLFAVAKLSVHVSICRKTLYIPSSETIYFEKSRLQRGPKLKIKTTKDFDPQNMAKNENDAIVMYKQAAMN